MKIINKEYFGAYLTGVFEASGCITIPKNNKYPKITLSFHKKNKALAEAIRERIGHGALYEKIKRTINYEIFNRDGILRFIEITKGYYRTPKINEYNDMINYLNTNKNTSLPLAKIDNSDLDRNAWLSGFLETNGGFFIYPSVRQGSIKSFIETGTHSYYRDYYVCFTLTHKKEYKEKYSYRPLLQEFAASFDTILHDHVERFGNICFTIRVDRLDSISMLLEYLEEFPVFGTRYANYLIIRQALSYQRRRRLHIPSFERRKKMKELKEKLNKELIDYRAEHLDSMPFYSE